MAINDRYTFEGSLFRDLKRNTATLYVEITDTIKIKTTPQLRIGFKHFYADNQTQTECIVKTTGQTVDGISVKIHAPNDDIRTYQLDFDINGSKSVVHWYTTKQGQNLVASSTAQTVTVNELFEFEDSKPKTILREFLNSCKN